MLCKVEEVRREMESRLDSQRRHMVQKESQMKNEVEELKVTCRKRHHKILHCELCWGMSSNTVSPSGPAVPHDGGDASPVRSWAFDKTGAGRGRTGEAGTAGAPQRAAANQESASCTAGIQGAESGRAAGAWMGAKPWAEETAAQGGVNTRIQSVTTVGSGQTYIQSAPITSAGRGGAQGWQQEHVCWLHQEEEQGGDSHLNRLG